MASRRWRVGLEVDDSGGQSSYALGSRMPSISAMRPPIHLIVDDLAAEVRRLRAEGVSFRNDIISGPGGQQVLLQDPSGNVVELFQSARSDTWNLAELFDAILQRDSQLDPVSGQHRIALGALTEEALVHMLQKVFLGIGGVLVLVGAIWIGQGAGLLPGSFMTGDSTWLGIGLAVGCVGLALIYIALQRPRMGSRRPRPADPGQGDRAKQEPPAAAPPRDAS